MSVYEYKDRAEIHKEAIEKWGCSHQAIVAIEELSELQKEICKHFRGADNLEAIAEETADVIIVLEQLQIMLDIHKMVSKKLDAKTMRLHGRAVGKYPMTTEQCEALLSLVEEETT